MTNKPPCLCNIPGFEGLDPITEFVRQAALSWYRLGGRSLYPANREHPFNFLKTSRPKTLFQGERTMFKRISIILSVLALASCATQPQVASVNSAYEGGRYPASSGCSSSPCVYIQDYNGSQAVFVGEGFTKSSQKSFQVNIYANGQFLDDINTNSNGSFSYTTPSGRATYGTRIEVKVQNWNGSGNHWTGSAVIARSNSGSGGGSSGQTSQQPPREPEYRMDSYKLREYAKQQARTVANRVAGTYGELEKWKYNFTMGYWQGLNAFQNSYEARVAESKGKEYGKNHGWAPGYDAGTKKGSEQAQEDAMAAAIARFKRVVNTDSTPDTAIGAIADPAFAGVNPSSNLCNTAGSYESQLENRLAGEMRVLRFGSDEYGYLVYEASLYSITFSDINRWGNGKFEFVDSYFRTSAAWDEWKDNDLGGKYDKNNYNKLASDQRSEFKRAFESEYDDRIDEKFYRKKSEYNSSANSSGQWYGVRVGEKRVYDRACNEEYARVYRPRSVTGFNDIYEPSYKVSFDRTVKYYNTHSVVTIDGVRLLEANSNGVYELGEELGVEVVKYTNLGRVAAKGVPVTLSGNGITPLSVKETVTLEASTSQTVNKKVPSLAKVRGDVIADRDYSVTASVGKSAHSLSFNVSWKSAIAALATSNSASLKNFVIKNIKDEYIATEAAKENIYKEGGQSKMLDLVELYESLESNQRGTILAVTKSIKAWQSTFEHKHNEWSTGKLRKNFVTLAARIK